MIQPGLERIGRLLKDVQLPWKAIHVAGTNGKGSICAHASHLLTRRTIRNGRFTSPHLIDRWDCITINDKPVSEQDFRKAERHFLALNQREGIGASEFELLTATAFHLFNEKKVEVGVVEVGMGGKLDATNILDNQAVSVISKIARDHQNFLGNTLEEIALHKAGILRPNVPYIVNPVNELNIHHVIDQYAKDIGAGPRIYPDTEILQREVFSTKVWQKVATTLLPFQRDNVVLAYLAFVEVMKSLDLSTEKLPTLLTGIENNRLSGRLQRHNVEAVFGASRRNILVDGSHNPDAAQALKEYVSKNMRYKQQVRERGVTPLNFGKEGRPITWVLAMTDGKDARQYLAQLLRAGDSIVTTSFGPVDGMPWVKPMDPATLRKIAMEVQPDITWHTVSTPGALRALCAAKYLGEPESCIVLTGSLYFVSDFLREKQKWHDDRESLDIAAIDKEERNAVMCSVSGTPKYIIQGISSHPLVSRAEFSQDEKEAKLQDEIARLDDELQFLEVEENRIKRSQILQFDTPITEKKWPKSLRDPDDEERLFAQQNPADGLESMDKEPEDPSQNPIQKKDSYSKTPRASPSGCWKIQS